MRLTFILLAMTMVGMAVMGLYVTRVLEASLKVYLTASMARDAQLLHDAIVPYVARGTPVGAAQELAHKYGTMLGPDARVSVIGVDGTVVGDSGLDLGEVRRLSNQGDLPEVRAALAGGIGNDLRRAQHGPGEMLYVAIPLADAAQVRGVLRIALP